VITLFRYQAELLLRSHRWIGPVVVYALFVWFTGGAGPGSQQLGPGLGWSAAALLPVVAWLTRQMLTAEPGEARACIAAAGGPRRVQVAALIAALASGPVLGLGGIVYDLVAGQAPGGPAGYARTIAVGLAAALICASVGSAIGALCNPPVVRTVAWTALSMIGVVVAALISSVSPANAAIRVAGTQPHASAWPVGPPLLAAAVLLAVSWTVSAVLAARRGL
jgi:hypothetical protein